MKINEKYPTSFSYARILWEIEGYPRGEKLPPVMGRIFMGRLNIMFTSVEHL